MKSIYTKLNEALAAVKKAGRTKQYEEASKTFTTTTPVETRLNAAEAVLKDVGIVREAQVIRESVIERLSHEQYQVFAKKLSKQPEMDFEEQIKLAEGILRNEIKEAQPAQPVRKNNGAGDNFVEGNPFGRPVDEFSPGYTKTDKATALAEKSDKVLFDGLLKAGSDHRGRAPQAERCEAGRL